MNNERKYTEKELINAMITYSDAKEKVNLYHSGDKVEKIFLGAQISNFRDFYVEKIPEEIRNKLSVSKELDRIIDEHEQRAIMAEDFLRATN